MLDPVALNRLIEQQITDAVNAQVQTVVSNNDWLVELEDKILSYTQDRILTKFANSSSMPEIIEAVKNSVTDLFQQGHIPGIDQFVNHDDINRSIFSAVEQTIQSAVLQLGQDEEWLQRVEHMINQTVALETISKIGSIDINTIICQRVDENMKTIRQQLLTDFASTGISDQATGCQLTIMDDNTVVENRLSAPELNIVGSAVIQDLAVLGSINTDNASWDTLATNISEKTLNNITEQWTQQLVKQVANTITTQGIDFDQVTIAGQSLISGNRLASQVTESNLQSLGVLTNLTVNGPANIHDTVHVVNRRLGINTQEPEMALSVWDEEVSVIVGKHKAKQAYIGTSRDQGIAIGTNRIPQVEIDSSGLTTIKKLQVGIHKISHSAEVPGWAGTKGDIVFNANPSENRVFAWVCLGSYKWQVIKGAE